MNTPTPRFYRSDLPPRPEDVARVRRVLQRGVMTRQALIERAGLSQTRTLCAIDALIAAGEVAYDAAAREFSLVASAKPSTA
jgi:hypothetical protein